MFILPSLAVNRLGPEGESPQAIMPKQFNDLLSKVRKSGIEPRPNSPFSPRRENASHASRAGRSPRSRIKLGKTAFSELDPGSFHPPLLMRSGTDFA
jgi:hypothetical protein